MFTGGKNLTNVLQCYCNHYFFITDYVRSTNNQKFQVLETDLNHIRVDLEVCIVSLHFYN